MNTLKPSCNDKDRVKQLETDLEDIRGILATQTEDIAQLTDRVDGHESQLTTDSITTREITVDEMANIKQVNTGKIDRASELFSTTEAHFDVGSLYGEGELLINLSTLNTSQYINITLSEGYSNVWSNNNELCNKITISKKDDLFYIKGDAVPATVGEVVVLSVYSVSDGFTLNVPTPVDAAIVEEYEIESKTNTHSVERPEWNNEPLATLADVVSGGVTEKFKGEVAYITDLPAKGDQLGDMYIITSEPDGVAKALWNGEEWTITVYRELGLYYNKTEIDEFFTNASTETDDKIAVETNRAVTEETRLGEVIANETTRATNAESRIDDTITANAETATNAVADVINGITPVTAIAQGATSGGRTIALTDDAFMLYGAQGMDNIPESSSLDSLVKCGQFNADVDLAATLTETPEAGAFDLVVGYHLANKDLPYQVWTGANSHVYSRYTVDGMYGDWRKLMNDKDVEAKLGEVSAFPGQIVMGASNVTPKGWLKCDGKAYNKVDYPSLFDAIGDTYRKPETPESMFNVPDTQNRYPIGESLELNTGMTVDEQLPNIRGEVLLGDGAHAYAPVAKASGCLNKKPTGGTFRSSGPDSTSADTKAVIGFDASEGGTKAVWKDNAKVRPDSITFSYFIKY